MKQILTLFFVALSFVGIGQNKPPQILLRTTSGTQIAVYYDTARSLSIPTISVLKTTNGYSGQNVSLSGYYSPSDGGGGQFVWDATSTEPDNIGTIIQVTGVTTGRWKRIIKGPTNAFWFGAIPDGSRDITVQLQTAISQTGHVIVPYSSFPFLQSDRYLIYSNTYLEIDPRNVMYEVSGTNTIQIRNAHLTDTITQIIDSNIHISGGIWDNNFNGNPGAGPYPSLQSDKGAGKRGAIGVICIAGVKGLEADNLQVKDGRSFATQFTNCQNVKIHDLNFIRTVATYSDGVHINGPFLDFTIRNITGATGDDFIALNAWDWLVSTASVTTGPISRGVIENIFPNACRWGVLKMLPGDKAPVTDIVVNNITAICENVGFVFGTLVDGYNPENNNKNRGLIKNISISNVKCQVFANPGTYDGINYGVIGTFVNTDITNFKVDGLLVNNYWKSFDTRPVFEFAANVSIDNFEMNALKVPETMPYTYLFSGRALINNFTLSNSYLRSDGSFTGNKATQAIVWLQNGIKNFRAVNNVFKDFPGLYYQDASGAIDSTFISLQNNTIDTFKTFVDSRIVTGVNLTGNTIRGNTQRLLYVNATQNANARMRVVSAGNYPILNDNNIIFAEGGASASWSGDDIQQNATQLTPRLGDIVFNNAPSLPAGKIISDGINWMSLAGAASNSPTFQNVKIANPGTGSYLRTSEFFAPANNIVGNRSLVSLGVNSSAKNAADIRFFYQGNGIDSNRLDLGFSGVVNPGISILAGGNVGVGTTAPTTKFHVVGTSLLSSANSNHFIQVLESGIGLFSTNITLGGPVYLSTQSTPADPINGQSVEWFDGTNKKAKKNVNGTITTITIY